MVHYNDIDLDFACRDDCLDQMVPSDLRQLVAERDRLRGKVASLIDNSTTVEGTTSGDMECWCLRVDEKTYRAVKGDKDADRVLASHIEDYSDEEHEDMFAPHEVVWMLYPSDLIKAEGRVRLTIMVEKLEG